MLNSDGWKLTCSPYISGGNFKLDIVIVFVWLFIHTYLFYTVEIDDRY